MNLLKKLTVGLLISTGLILVACKANPSAPPAPPTGSLNSFDADTNTTLETLHAFVDSLVTQNNAGTVMLTATQKADLNQAVKYLNIADSTYQAWHAAGGTGATAPVTAAVTKAQNAKATLNTAIQGGK
jgi:hypothetical protein